MAKQKSLTEAEKTFALYEKLMSTVFTSGVSYTTILGTLRVVEGQVIKQMEAQTDALVQAAMKKERPEQSYYHG